MPALSDYINNDYKPLDSAETVADVQDFFAEVTFSHFPVVEESVYIGCVSSDDVETFDAEKPIYHYRYAMEGFFARKDAVWLDVLEVFASNQTNVVPVLDEHNAYVGYYEIQDVMRMFNETPFLKEPGGVIVVQKGIADYSMSEVAQIVESNNGRVLGLFISHADATAVQVTVKISLGAINEILQTFRRYNYEVVSAHEEDEYRNSLKERSDYLDKYLNL
jgi:predicted transcriptional regulator